MNEIELETVATGVGLFVAQCLEGKSDEEIRFFIDTMHCAITAGGEVVRKSVEAVH